MPQVDVTPGTRPENVGILAIEIYFPKSFVEQEVLEDYDNVSKGKYTIGLGQKQMGFCHDDEDVNSLCLTVVARLMEKNKIKYSDIGRLEVGTETIIDKSKSVKSVLMQLFDESGNYNVEGIDTTNACYGGTSALFNALAWVESSMWDGRYALVVCGDIAVYASGNARCTGGAGSVAMLIGPSAPLIVEPGLRGTHMRHTYDFYKPDLTSEYPTVDGTLSVHSYISALDSCYNIYSSKANKLLKLKDKAFSLSHFDFMLFHSPYCKLVQKSMARLTLNDFVRNNTSCYSDENQKEFEKLPHFRDISLKDCIFDKNVEKAFIKASEKLFNAKTLPSLLLAKRVGNMYTPSLYSCLVSLLISVPLKDIAGKRIGMFSYGSGLASSLFSIHVTDEVATTQSSNFPNISPLERLLSGLLDVKTRLDSRECLDPSQFTRVLERRENTHLHCNYKPQATSGHLFPGTFYLTRVDDKYRRTYQRKPLSDKDVNGNASTFQLKASTTLHHNGF